MKAMGRGSIASFMTGLLDLSWYVVALGIVLTALLAVLSPFVAVQNSTMRITIPVSFSVDARMPRVSAPSLGIEDAQVRAGSPGFGFEFVGANDVDRVHLQHVSGSLRFPTPSRAFFVGNAVFFLVLLAFVLGVLGQLRGVFRTLRDGQPFVAANATRIRYIALLVIFGEIALSGIVFFENRYAMTYFSAEGLHFDAWPDVNALTIIHGVIILVIAEVFRAGTRLDEDQSLTV
jgi:hypothetical protein